MEENLNGMNVAEGPRTYGEESQMYENNQPNQGYGQPYQGYGQSNYNQGPYAQGYMPLHGEVKDTFCNILIVLMPIRVILAIVINIMTFSAMGNNLSIMEGSYLITLNSGLYSILSMLSNLLSVAYIVFVILDIVKVKNANYKIGGLVLFAIFLNPGYYIWRAHILGRQKTIPIVYTVLYSILNVVSIAIAFYYSIEMVFGIMQTMY